VNKGTLLHKIGDMAQEEGHLSDPGRVLMVKNQSMVFFICFLNVLIEE
jgi:hypothetical protein